MKDEAFGLPRGTIRALLAIFVVMTICGGFLMGMIGKEVISALAGCIVTFYFTKKNPS